MIKIRKIKKYVRKEKRQEKEGGGQVCRKRQKGEKEKIFSNKGKEGNEKDKEKREGVE